MSPILFRSWVVVSVISDSRGKEEREMRRTWTRYGARTWATFYTTVMNKAMENDPSLFSTDFAHYYEIRHYSDRGVRGEVLP